MSAPGSNEDLSPSDFVRKIRELGEKKDSEDAERVAMLEQDILKGREERAARRAGEWCMNWEVVIPHADL